MSQGTRPAAPDQSAVIDNLLEFGGGFLALPYREISIAANVGGIETRGIDRRQHPPIFDWRDTLRVMQNVSLVVSPNRQLCANSAQPKRLHLGIEPKPLVQILRQGLSSPRFTCHGKRQRSFGLDALTCRSKLQGLG